MNSTEHAKQVLTKLNIVNEEQGEAFNAEHVFQPEAGEFARFETKADQWRWSKRRSAVAKEIGDGVLQGMLVDMSMEASEDRKT